MLVELIPKIAAMEAREKEPKEYYPRPSQAGPERCTRQMYYHKLDYPQREPDDRMWLVFDDSIWHEELTADWIRKTSFTLQSQQKRIDLGIKIPGYSYCLGGNIDGILLDLMGDKRLWEHKAINHFDFVRYWEDDTREVFPWDNICQACIYCKGLQSEAPNIKEILLVIKNKNTSHYIEYLIEYHDDAALIKECTHSTGETRKIEKLVYFPISYCIDKFFRIEMYALEKNPPAREYEMDYWRCEYCPYRDECWEGFLDEIEGLRTGVMMEQDVADLCAYFQQVKAQVKEMEKEREELRGQILDIMHELKAKQGRAGEFTIKLTGQTTIRLDKKLIPDSILSQVSSKHYSERLWVNKPKPKPKKNKKGKGNDKNEQA